MVLIRDIKLKFAIRINSERKGNRMKEIINFIKDICMLKEQDKTFIGLSQFKYSKAPVIENKPPVKKSEIKISDLMRKSF